MIIDTCDTCGKEIKDLSLETLGEGIYCSPECMAKDKDTIIVYGSFTASL